MILRNPHIKNELVRLQIHDIERAENLPIFYGQHAEDLIAFGLLQARHLGLSYRDVSYIDIGANHPINCSNTYLFYKSGARGVAIEPNRHVAEIYKKHRPNDKLIVAGAQYDDLLSCELKITSNDQLSSFSLEHIDSWNRTNPTQPVQIESTESVAMINVNDLASEYFLEKNKKLHILSVDVEGCDLQVLQKIDFSIVLAELVIVEFVVPGRLDALDEIHDLLEENGYKIHYKGRVNAIFIKDS
jgi:FkbM family methyltransferase